MSAKRAAGIPLSTGDPYVLSFSSSRGHANLGHSAWKGKLPVVAPALREGATLLLLLLLRLPRQVAEVTLCRILVGTRNALLHDHIGRFLARGLNLARHFRAALLLEVLSRREAVEDLLPLRIELRFCLAVKRTER